MGKGENGAYGITELETPPDIDEDADPCIEQGKEPLLLQVLAHGRAHHVDPADVDLFFAKGVPQSTFDLLNGIVPGVSFRGGPDEKLVVSIFTDALDRGIGKPDGPDSRAHFIGLDCLGKGHLDLCPAGEIDPVVQAPDEHGDEADDDEYRRKCEGRLPVFHEIYLGSWSYDIHLSPPKC